MFFVTAIQGQVTQDQVLSLVQFKQVSNLAFINFLGTKNGTFSKSKVGNKTPFMSKDQTYQGMGLALLFFCSVQLYLCCLGKTPILIIQVEVATQLNAYLLSIGFKAAT
jgi:hypothetical protein